MMNRAKASTLRVVILAAAVAAGWPAAAAEAGEPAATPIADYYRVEGVPTPDGVVAEVGGMDFTPGGKLVVAFERGEVYVCDPETGEWARFAEGLHGPLGVLALSEREVLVSQRPELTRLLDTTGDGAADRYETITDAFGMTGNYHEFHFGTVRDGAGNVYISLNLASRGAGVRHEVRGEFRPDGRPGRMYAAVPYRGWVMRINDAAELEPFAVGFRSPNGLGFDAAGNLFVTDNEGDWLGTSKLFHVQRDRFYGHPGGLVWRDGFEGVPSERPTEELDARRERAAVLFPHGVMANSPTQPLADLTGGAFGPFDGQLIVGEMNRARLLRVMLEEVAGEMQGACVVFIDDAGLRSGNNRLAFGPEGDLWVGQTHRERNWAGDTGIQRVTWTGEPPMEVLEMNLTEDGFAVTFTRPLDLEAAGGPAVYRFQRYYYQYREEYGSPQMDVRDVAVTAASVSEDRRTVRLTLDELAPGYVYEMTLAGVESADGAAVVNPVVCYTLNRLLDGTEAAGGEPD